MLESFKNRALLLKLEAVEGTDALPTPALDAFQLFDGTSGLLSDRIERPVDRPFFGSDPFVNTNFRGFIEGGFELVPPATPVSGTSKASIDALLQSSGMAKSFLTTPNTLLRYNPVSSGIPSATGLYYHSGLLYRLTGARSNVSSLMMDIGSYLKGQCRIEGSCVEVQEAALPTGLVYTPFFAPTALTTETMEMRINGFAVEGKSISIDFGNEQKTIEHTEARINRITGRNGKFSAKFYKPARASLDPWALWRVGTVIPVYGQQITPGSVVLTKISALVQIEEVKPVDIDGDYGYEVTGRCIPSSAGGDEFMIDFIDPTI